MECHSLSPVILLLLKSISSGVNVPITVLLCLFGISFSILLLSDFVVVVFGGVFSFLFLEGFVCLFVLEFWGIFLVFEKCVSCRQHMIGFCFYGHCNNLLFYEIV